MATRKKTSKPPSAPQTPPVDSPPEPAAEPIPFFERMGSLSPDDWERGWKIYCYRTWPIIDRRENEHFICKLKEPIDEEYLLRCFGSGKYFLRLNDSHGKTATSKSVSVHNPEYPPKVSPIEVVAGDPRNDLYFRVWPPPEDSKQPVTPSSELNVAVQALVALTQKSLDRGSGMTADEREMFKTAHAETLKLVTEQAREPEHKETLNDLLQALISAKALLAPTPQAGLLDDLEKLTAAVTAMRDLFPPPPAPEVQPASGDSSSGLLQWVQVLSTPAASVLAGKLVDLLTFGIAAAAKGGRPVSAPASATQPAGPPAKSVAAPSPAVSPTTAETAPTEPGSLTQKDLVEIGKRALAALNEGYAGDDFAVSLSVWRGESVYRQIVATGEELLLTLLLPAVPPEDQPEVKKFVGEFFAYGDEETPTEAGEAAEPTAQSQPDSPPATPAPHKEATGNSETG